MVRKKTEEMNMNKQIQNKYSEIEEKRFVEMKEMVMEKIIKLSERVEEIYKIEIKESDINEINSVIVRIAETFKPELMNLINRDMEKSIKDLYVECKIDIILDTIMSNVENEKKKITPNDIGNS